MNHKLSASISIDRINQNEAGTNELIANLFNGGTIWTSLKNKTKTISPPINY